jgi:hypothetical protein
MPSAAFEPAILAGQRPQTYALDRAVTGIDDCVLLNNINFAWYFPGPDTINLIHAY